MPSEDDPRRVEVRQWLAENPNPSGGQLAAAGYVVPHWPEPYGLNSSPMHQLIIDDELTKAGVSRPANPIGVGWACLLYTSPSPRDATLSRMPSSA